MSCKLTRRLVGLGVFVTNSVLHVRATLSVVGHTGTVIAVYILFHRVTKYILYRFKVTGSLRFASNLQYSSSHPLEALYCAFCVMFCFEPDAGLIQM